MADAPAPISLPELNRATLARQLLLKRRRLGIAAAVQALGAVQSQHPDWPPVALASRVAGFDPDALRRASARRSVVRAGLHRMTLHLITATDFWPLWHLLQPMRLDQWRLMTKLDPADRRIARRLTPAVNAAVDALRDGPLRREEFTRVLETHTPADLRELPHRGLSRYFMAVQPLVQVPERGEIYGRGRYVTAEEWIGPSPAGADDLDAARVLVVRRHLAAFGPASLADILAWIGRRGSIGSWRTAIEMMRDDLVELRTDDGRTVLDLRTAPRPDAETPAPPRFLARWDSVLLAHEPKHRTRILPAAAHARVFTNNADVLPTFLIDGMVAGTWTAALNDGVARMTVQPFSRLDRRTQEGLEAEARAMLRVIAGAGATTEVTFASP
jgi:hypothetical protein